MKRGMLIIIVALLFPLLNGCSAEYIQRHSGTIQEEEPEMINLVETVPGCTLYVSVPPPGVGGPHPLPNPKPDNPLPQNVRNQQDEIKRDRNDRNKTPKKNNTLRNSGGRNSKKRR